MLTILRKTKTMATHCPHERIVKHAELARLSATFSLIKRTKKTPKPNLESCKWRITFHRFFSNEFIPIFCDFMQCVDVPPNHIYEPRNDKPNLTFLKKAAWMCLRIQFPAADDSFISTLMAAGCRTSLWLHTVVTASHHTFQTPAKMEQEEGERQASACCSLHLVTI